MEDLKNTPLFHRILMGSLVAERVPAALVFGLLVAVSALASLTWSPASQLTVMLSLAGLMIADWAGLALLPRLKRSYGPIKPPLLSLALVRAGIGALSGLLGPIVWVYGLIQVFVLIVSLFSTWVEPFRLGVTHQTLISPHFDPDAPPLRLLHLSDLHIERLTRREERLQRLIDDLAPDLIVFTGDFVNLSYRGDPRTIEHIQQVAARWRARLGVFCVSGTPLVEPHAEVARFVERSDVRWLRNEPVAVEAEPGQLTILGVDCAFRREGGLPRLQAAAESLPQNDSLKILLYHTPDLAPEAAEHGIDLYLCGHTHGGQIRLPLYGAIITASEWGKRFEMGRYEVNGMTLYVSRGIGLEGGGAPRARFLCPPEIVLWELRGSDD